VIVRISPTRMELIRLRRRLIIAQRGHKLLEDKLEGLMKEFLTLVEEYRVLRLELARELPAAFARFALGSATSSPKIIDLALRECEKEIDLQVGTAKIMNTPVPRFTLRVFKLNPTYSAVITGAELDLAIASVREIFERLIMLAEKEESVRRLAKEVEKTRRRVNALEYTIIPQFQQTVKFITAKLDEIARSSRTQIMKIKDILTRTEG
jgi:V/A-type H+-transporting ATPase subunit D